METSAAWFGLRYIHQWHAGQSLLLPLVSYTFATVWLLAMSRSLITANLKAQRLTGISRATYSIIILRKFQHDDLYEYLT